MNWGKTLVYLLILTVSAFIILPILFTIIGSFSEYWGTRMFSRGWTLKWYGEVFRYYGNTISFTFIISLLTVLINIVLGTMTAYRLSQSTSRWTKLAEEILTLPLAIP